MKPPIAIAIQNTVLVLSIPIGIWCAKHGPKSERFWYLFPRVMVPLAIVVIWILAFL